MNIFQKGLGATFVIIIIAFMVILGGFFYYGAREEPFLIAPGRENFTPGEGGSSQTETGGESLETQTQTIQTPNESAGVKEFSLTGWNFAFSEKEIRVRQGDRVRIIFASTDGFHDWVVDEFSARTDRVRIGETASVEFAAGKKGEFEYYCSVGNHRQLGMKGRLIVE